jgi:hypothetical protein
MSGPPFERHLFISYAHIDNQPLSPDQQGWVTRFHASLDTVLSTRMGRRAEIWRDAKLAGNDVFSDEILAQFPRTAILVSIVSPRYVESEWCLREVREFVNEAQRSSSLVVDNKSRVIKVIKLPVDTEDPLPPVMKQVLGYPFFTIGDDQAPIELDPAYGEKLVQGYNLKVAKLAWDIAQLVKKLEAETVVAAPAAAAGQAVYLSECSYDRRDQREALETELRMHGYTVLPDAELPRDEDAYRAEVARHLQRCSLSVHLVGSLYGSVPDGPSQKSVVAVQNELAIAESRRRGLARIIWIPKGTEPRGAEQEAFVRSLHTTAEAQFGADVIIDDIESLKTAVRDALKRLEKPQAPVRDAAASSRLVYVVCDARDRKESVPLRRLLQRAGFDAEIPVFSGDAATVRQANQDLLAQCDAAVVFYGTGDEAWRRTVENDLRKSLAYRQDKPALIRFTYLAPPATEDKTDLIDVEEPDLINGLRGEPTEADIQPLIDALRDR